MEHSIITGGAGFIGSHLADLLLSKGHFVTIIDHFQTGSERNIRQLRGHAQCNIIHGDCINVRLWAHLVPPQSTIYHLAASVGVDKVTECMNFTTTNNVDSTIAVLKVATDTDSRVFVASTSEVYGDQGECQLDENRSLTVNVLQKGRSAYTISKLYGELLSLNAFEASGLRVVVGRLFNTTGPRQRGHYGMVVPKFADQVLAGEPITVFGDGEQRRSFCHVSDTVKALYALMQNPNAYGEIVNIGNDEEISINELAHYIARLGNHTNTINYQPLPPGRDGGSDILYRRPNLGKLRQLTQLEPAYTWQEAVNDVWADRLFSLASRHVQRQEAT